MATVIAAMTNATTTTKSMLFIRAQPLFSGNPRWVALASIEAGGNEFSMNA
jgi:hypothetical protein